MPFTLEDLEQIRVRMGTGTRSLRGMSDTQFTAWLRAQGARGEIGVITTAPGHVDIPEEERVRVLNDLESAGFYIPGVMGIAPAESSGPDPAELDRAHAQLEEAARQLQDIAALLGELGELDSRVNMRASIHGAVELIDLLRGAIEHARRARMSRQPI